MCVCVFVHVGGLTLNLEIALNNWINSLNTTSSLGIRVAPATRTRGEGGLRPPSPLVIIIKITIIYFAMQCDEEFVFREKRFSVVC